jgi:hypothetical protein
VPNHDVTARTANKISANGASLIAADRFAPSCSRDREGKTGTHLFRARSRRRLGSARIETNNNTRAGRLLPIPGERGECRVAIAPMALHKRGWLNNQSSNALEAVMGYA